MEPAPQTAAPPPSDPSQDRAERHARSLEERTERHLRMLQELAEVGMKLVRAVERVLDEAVPEPEQAEPEQATAPQASAPKAPAPDRLVAAELALVYSRVARALRQTMALEAKLDEDRWTWDQRQAAEQTQRTAAAAQARKAGQKSRAKRIIEDAIDAEFEGSHRENLLIDLDLRLDDEDLFSDYDDRPFGESIVHICRDLGLTPQFSRWEAEAWGIEAGGTEDAGIEETGSRPSPSGSHSPDPHWPDPYWPDPAQIGWSKEARPGEPSSAEPSFAEASLVEVGPPPRAATGLDPP